MNWGWGSLVDLLKLAAGGALMTTGIGAGAGLPLLLGSASLGLSGASGLADDASAPSDDEIADNRRDALAAQLKASKQQPYRRSQFMPDESQDYSPMARYSPRNRQPSSGIDPQILAHLRRFTQSR